MNAGAHSSNWVVINPQKEDTLNQGIIAETIGKPQKENSLQEAISISNHNAINTTTSNGRERPKIIVSPTSTKSNDKV